jgi:3-oxoacyl-[acyl-carrier protein] reductase
MRNVFITGSTRGIGLSLAKKFIASSGYRLIVHGSKDLEESEILEIFGVCHPDKIKYLGLDLTETKSVSSLDVNSLFTGDNIDIFINNAGIYSSDSIEKIVNVNLTSGIILTDKVYQLMKSSGGGMIININSVAGITPNYSESIYCSTKFGLDGYFKSLNEESYKHSINIIQYYLGAVRTDMTIKREDHNMLIDPNELSDCIFSDLDKETFITPLRVIKRKKY